MPGNSIATAAGFDGLDRLSNTVCSTLGKTVSADYAYNANGKVATVTSLGSAPGGYAMSYSYDAENRLSGITGMLSHSTVLSLAYTYNSAQQITNMDEKMAGMTNTHAYTYDDRDQLAGERIPERRRI